MTDQVRESDKLYRKRSFRSGLTREFLVLLGVDLLCSGGMIAEGIAINKTWMGRGHVFIGVGVAIILCAALLARSILGRTVTISTQSLQFEKGTRKVTIPWQVCRTFMPSNPGRKWFCSTVVGDHTRSLTIDSLSFPDYELIVKLIGGFRQREKSAPDKMPEA